VNVLARIISYVFHPLLMGTYLFALMALLLPVALYPINSDSQLLFVGVYCVMSFILPILMISMLKVFGSVKSFTMENRQERVFPFIMILVLYLTFTYMLTFKNKIGFEDNLFKFVLIIDALVLVSTLITLFYKVSVHAIGIAGLAGILLPLNQQSDNELLLWVTIGVVVLAGVVMSARLQLNAHTPRQILVGALTGLLIGFFGVTFLF
jgi:membrane-associated phospholipid phosphatase